MLKLLRSLLLLVGVAAISACAPTEMTAGPPPATVNTPAPAASLPEAQPQRVSHSVTVYFDSDRADIRASAMQILYQSAQSVRGAAITRIHIDGFADAAGNKAHNQALSERRAAAVADQLAKLGVTSPTVEVKGLGEVKAHANTARHSRLGRRVEITIEAVFPTSQAASSANISSTDKSVSPVSMTAENPAATSALAPVSRHAAAAPLRSPDKRAIKLLRALDAPAHNPILGKYAGTRMGGRAV
ncbi:MAG TPA: OmpA family protein [Magnetospirillum sp.]|nr:OmpA family protein [Magnetospirillum sp.]